MSEMHASRKAMGGGALSSYSVPMWRQVLSLFLSAVLVFQNLTCWMTPAWASELVGTDEPVAEQAQVLDDESDGLDDEGELTEQQSVDGADGVADEAETATNGAVDETGSNAAGHDGDEAGSNESADVAVPDAADADGTTDDGATADADAVDESGDTSGSDADASADNSQPEAEGADSDASVTDAAGDKAADPSATDAEGESADAAAAADNAQGATANEASADEPAAQSDENAADLTGSYNPSADPVVIDGTNTSDVSLTITYADGSAWNGEAITADTPMKMQLSAKLSANVVDVEHPSLSYAFPSNVAVSDHSETVIYDGNLVKATWSIKNGVFYLTYGEEWLRAHPSEISLTLDADFKVTNQKAGDGDSIEIVFPGKADSITIPIKDGKTTGSKWCQVNADTMTVSWTIALNVATKATNVVLTDTIGSNLTFDGATFTFNGASVTPTISGQTATFSLGTLEAGHYELKYTTPINPDAWKTATDGQALSGVNNSASWTWGSNGESGRADSDPGSSLITKMASKSASGTPQDITWTATLNTGSLKADMNGYTFTDTLGAGHTYTGSYTITDSTGTTVATGSLPTDGSNFTYTFSGLANGKQSYTIVYHTTMTDTSSTNKVTNHVDVTPGPDGGPSGSADADFTPSDEGTVYVAKKLVSSATAATDGYATWESTIYFSNFSQNTDPTSITFTDEVNAGSGQRMVIDQVKLKAGDTELVAGVDYTITTDGQHNKLELTFKNTDAVKAALGKTDVVVTYRTSSNAAADVYTNTSTVKKGDVKKKATASYTVKSDKIPAVLKTGSIKWNADFDWSSIDGSADKGAWVADWKVTVNQGSDGKPATDLGGKDLVITDDLPDGMSYVTGSSSYYLITESQTYGYWPWLRDDPAVSGNQIVYTIGTATYNGSALDSTTVKVELTYQTAAKSSAVGTTATQFTNTATAVSGDKTFPGGSSTVEAVNKLVTKGSAQVQGSSNIRYTINVNEAALDLSDEDTLTLVDTMDAKCTYAPASFHAYYHGTTTEVPGVSTNVENVTTDSGAVATRLTVTLPDATAIDVVYEVTPAGEVGDQVSLSNTCYLKGYENQGSTDEKTWTIQKASADTEGTGYGITISKYDGADPKKALAGATFECYKVNWDGSTELVGSAQTTDTSGKVSFGTEADPLASLTLYYFVETAAPTGYEISYTGKTYFMFKGSHSKSEYAEALEKCKALGVTSPSAATSFGVADKKCDLSGGFTIDVLKTVNGGTPAEGQTFEFTATSTDEGAPVLTAVTTDASGKATFTGSLTDSNVGKTYTYTISESTDLGNGWTKASDSTVTVTVSENADGTALIGTVDYGSDSATYVSMNNTYEATGTATISVYKTVNGGTEAKPGEVFTFDLLDSEGNTLGTVETEMGKVADFDELQYTLDDAGETFTYTIHEVGHDGDGWTAASDVTATVTVSDNGDGTLSTTVAYSNGTNAADFDDTHSVATAEIKVAKTVNGGPLQEHEQFTFELLDSDGKGLGSVTIKGTDEHPVATFEGLTFDKTGTYTYTIHETSDLGDGWQNDGDVIVTITVERDEGAKQLVATVEYDRTDIDNNAAQFDNLHDDQLAVATIKVDKTVNNQKLDQVTEKFTFALLDADGNQIGNDITVDGTTTAEFEPIAYDEPGTYAYTVHETSDHGDGWVNAPDVKVSVEVGYADNGRDLEVKAITYNGEKGDAAKFNNTSTHYPPDEPVTPEKPDQPDTPKSPETPTQPHAIPKTADETPVEGMALAAGAGLTVMSLGAFLALRSRKRDEF